MCKYIETCSRRGSIYECTKGNRARFKTCRRAVKKAGDFPDDEHKFQATYLRLKGKLPDQTDQKGNQGKNPTPTPTSINLSDLRDLPIIWEGLPVIGNNCSISTSRDVCGNVVGFEVKFPNSNDGIFIGPDDKEEKGLI